MELLEYTVKAFYEQIDSAADCLEQAYKQLGLEEEKVKQEALEEQKEEARKKRIMTGFKNARGVLEYNKIKKP